MLFTGLRGLPAFALALLCSHSSVAQIATAILPNCSRIMPLGDSLTVGGNGGYRKHLYVGLAEKKCGVSFVGTQYDEYTQSPEKSHEGHPYFTIADIANGVEGWIASAQPNIILLMIGTNDIASWNNSTVEEIAARLDALVEKIQRARPEVWIFVASIPPMSPAKVPPKNSDRAVVASQYNSAVRNVVQKRNTNGRVLFVDVNAALSVDDLSDGIHPKEASQIKIAEKFLAAIGAALEPASPAVATPASSPPATAPVSTTPTSPTPAPAQSPSSSPTPASSAMPPSSGGAMEDLLSLLLIAFLVKALQHRVSNRDGFL